MPDPLQLSVKLSFNAWSIREHSQDELLKPCRQFEGELHEVRAFLTRSSRVWLGLIGIPVGECCKNAF